MEARRKQRRLQTARRTPSQAVSADAKLSRRPGPRYFSLYIGCRAPECESGFAQQTM